MRIRMQRAESLALEEMARFLDGSEEIVFAAEGKAEMYDWVGKVLEGRDYERLSKAGRGLVKRFLEKVSGRRGGRCLPSLSSCDSATTAGWSLA
ncbi:MAG: hypothetical protein IT169_15715 [Bryobacterales bacterium]|nr:hypothetical protein [Bryobacterales bacterium]